MYPQGKAENQSSSRRCRASPPTCPNYATDIRVIKVGITNQEEDEICKEAVRILMIGAAAPRFHQCHCPLHLFQFSQLFHFCALFLSLSKFQEHKQEFHPSSTCEHQGPEGPFYELVSSDYAVAYGVRSTIQISKRRVSVKAKPKLKPTSAWVNIAP